MKNFLISIWSLGTLTLFSLQFTSMRWIYDSTVGFSEGFYLWSIAHLDDMGGLSPDGVAPVAFGFEIIAPYFYLGGKSLTAPAYIMGVWCLIGYILYKAGVKLGKAIFRTSTTG